jgi:fructokinase
VLVHSCKCTEKAGASQGKLVKMKAGKRPHFTSAFCSEIFLPSWLDFVTFNKAGLQEARRNTKGTRTPVIHKTMSNASFDVVCFGEVLWDLLPSGAQPGGAPMNVAYHLRKLGLRPALISRIGRDELGKKLLGIMEGFGLPPDFIQQDDIHSTGIVQATINEKKEASYEIVQPVAWDFIDTAPSLPLLVQNAPYFVFGSLAARSERSRNTLLELVAAANTRILDINFRPPHYSLPLAEELLQKCDLLKLNEHELPLISGWYHQLVNMEDQIRSVQDRFSIPTIVVTRGGDGAVVCHQGRITQHKGFKVRVADTVGSGDAFLAAFIAQVKQGAGMMESLEFANALGALVASKPGACPEYIRAQCHDLMI